MVGGKWSRKGHAVHCLSERQEQNARRQNRTVAEPLQDPHPDYKWHHQTLSAHSKSPSTQDLGDKLGLETYSGELDKHFLLQS